MSARYNTGNPIESTDVRDMSDNAKNFDEFGNSTENSFIDRLGVTRKTIHGMNSEFNDEIIEMNSEFYSNQASMNAKFESHILRMGFTRVGTFTAGATLTNTRQTLLWDVADGGDGQEYGWSGSFLPSGKVVQPGSTPLTAGGIAVGAWMSRFDPAMRQQLREALRRSYAEAGYTLVEGSFELGGTLNTITDALLYEYEGKAYSWGGVLPKVVPANSTPNSTGGMGTDKWISQANSPIRDGSQSFTLQSLKSRAPSRADNGDFGTTNVWRASDGLYISNRVSPGKWATWLKDRTFYPKIGSVRGSVTPDAIWWLAKVMNNYSGPCINVTNVSLGTSVDIGFDANGNLDVNSLGIFLGPSSGIVNTWYDQSGNGHHLTSSGDNRPIISSVNKVGNLRGIVFETPVVYNGASTPNQFLTIPNTLSGQSNNVSFSCFCSLASTVRDAPILELTGSDGKYTAIGKREQNGADGIILYQNSSPRLITGHQPPIKDNFFTASFSGTVNYYGNDTVSESGTVTAGITWTGGKIGSTTNLFIDGASNPRNGGAIIAGIALYKRATPVLESRNMFASVVEAHEIIPQCRGNLVLDGDSITEGAFATFFDSYPSVVAESIVYGAKVYQVAKSGGTSSTQNTSRGKWESKLYKPTAPFNIVVYGIGTNDIGTGISAGAVYANIQTYVDAVKSIGYNVVLATVLPRQSFIGNQNEVERLALNQMLRDNWRSLGCLGLIDYRNEGTMGSTSFVGNTAYYTDGTHPTPIGYALMGIFARETIEEVIAKILQLNYIG